MKQSITISFALLNILVFGQKQKLPPKDTYYLISKTQCEFPRQIGKLEIIKNDSLKFSKYKTDSSEMILFASHFQGFLTDWNNKDEADNIYLQMDSIVSVLFKNGLLTSDLLIKAYNSETKVIDHKGDTLDWTHHIEAKTVKILNIEKKQLTKKYKNEKGIMLFEIWASFSLNEDGWGAFPVFDLYLQNDLNTKPENIIQYLLNAKIKCLENTGIQI